MPADPGGAGAPQGLAWSGALDFDALTRCTGGPGSPDAGTGGSPGGGSGDGGDEEAAQQAVLDDVAEHGSERIPAGALAGQMAGHLPPGPDAAAWLAVTPVAEMKDHDLAAAAGSWRRIAPWAQAQELAAVARIASRAAAREKDTGTGADGRPARIPATATAGVSLELTMSQSGASWWTGLAVDLAWRLAATGAALAAGKIDLSRARLIAEATRTLSDEAARVVEGEVLPAAGDKTTGALRAVLRREVIVADPEGAERRRKETGRQAKVSLYPDEETTATLADQRLPAVHAAAAMARITAMARAWKASGAGGPVGLLRAKAYLGLLLGTMPQIPPAEGAPPGDRPDDAPGDRPPRGHPDGSSPSRGHPPGHRPPRGSSDGSGQSRGSRLTPRTMAATAMTRHRPRTRTRHRPRTRTRHRPRTRTRHRPRTRTRHRPRTRTRHRPRTRTRHRPRTRTRHRPGTRTLPAMTRTTRARTTTRPGTAGMTLARMTTPMTAGRPGTGRMSPRASRPRSPGPGTGGRQPAGCSICPCPGAPWPGSLSSPAG